MSYFDDAIFKRHSSFRSHLEGCVFEDCEIDGFECDGTEVVTNVVLRDCRVISFSSAADGLEICAGTHFNVDAASRFSGTPRRHAGTVGFDESG